jgi:[ribosomal protein S5]-alanine N-acetyltransferase
MTVAQLPPWPTAPVAYGPVVLRRFSPLDVPMVQEMSADPHIPLIGALPPNASQQEARDYIDRQIGRLAEGTGFSFAIAEAGNGRTVGGIGLWLRQLAHGRATAGYSVTPSARGRDLASAALTALTSFGWTIPAQHRIELYIEPWNVGSGPPSTPDTNARACCEATRRSAASAGTCSCTRPSGKTRPERVACEEHRP